MTVSIENDGALERSLEELVGPSKTAMPYGFSHCRYTRIRSKLSKMNFTIYDCCLCISKKVPEELSFLIHPKSSSLISVCQMSLTNIVIENYKKTFYGNKNLITVLFCIDTNNNPYSPINLSNKKKYKKLREENLITILELRRAYKLCYDTNVDPKIRKAALKTFKFVKVIQDHSEKVIGMKKTSPPWSKRYVASPDKARKAKDPKNWRCQVNTIVRMLNPNSKWL